MQLSVEEKDCSYAAGKCGSKQKISILLPVDLKNSKRACITFVLLNTRQEFAGNISGSELKTFVLTLPEVYVNSFDESRLGRGNFAILSSGNS